MGLQISIISMLIPMLLKLFQKIEKYGRFPYLFYKVNKALMSKPYTKIRQKTRLQTYKLKWKNSKYNFSEQNPVRYQKYKILWPSMIYSKNAAYFNIRKSVNIICYISKLKEGKNMLVTVYAHKAFANTAAIPDKTMGSWNRKQLHTR